MVAATNRDLEQEVAAGRFRADLYYRLKVVPVEIPPLRSRIEDVAPLARFFLAQYRREFGVGVEDFAMPALRAMEAYGWPGNVRELRNAVERAALLAPESQICLGDLPPEVGGGSRGPAEPGGLALPAEGVDLQELERRWVLEALERCGGNRSRAAKLLGMNRDQIRYRIEKFGLEGQA